MTHTCGHCARSFPTAQALRQHQQDKHGARRRLPSWERPRDRGEIECFFCTATFATEADALQHLADKHGAPAFKARRIDEMDKPTKLLVIDTETSDLPNYKLPADHPSQPRLANLAMILATRTPDALHVEREANLFVKPDGWTISPSAAAVNGLTMEQLERDGLPIAEVLAQYVAAIKEGRAVVAFNAQHDCKVMRGELRRRGLPDLFEETPNVCCMRKSMGIVVKQDGKKGWPKLSDACAHFGIEQKEPHKALADARSCLTIYDRLIAAGVDLTPEVHFASEKTRDEIAKNSATPQGDALRSALKESLPKMPLGDAEIPE